ncbi:MAG: hypothetical protein IJ856_00655 [Candidatus Methanomethylophilaceae archaeon]|nr:hypothetical protein [Candidatus Methanomethylophilaceae archaeon]
MNVLKNGNTSNKEYFNGSLATLGDSVLKMIITEKLYLEGKDRGSITASKSRIESNKNLHFKTLELNIQSFAYNDQFFFDDAPKHLQLPNPGHDIYIEAIVGAIYLDRGLEYCKEWIESNILIDWTFEETSVS